MGVSPSARPPAPGRPVDRDRSPPNEQRAAAEAEVTIASEELGKGKEGVRVVRESAVARGSQKGGRPWLAAWRVIQVLKDHFIHKLPRILPSLQSLPLLPEQHLTRSSSFYPAFFAGPSVRPARAGGDLAPSPSAHHLGGEAKAKVRGGMIENERAEQRKRRGRTEPPREGRKQCVHLPSR